MFGFLPAAPEPGVGESCAWAVADALKSTAVAISSDKLLGIRFLFILAIVSFILAFLLFSYE
jgi:hypothetical protein